MKNREIKFRAWNVTKAKYYKPIHDAYKGNLSELMIGFGGDILEHNIKGVTHQSALNNTFILEQYTGLKDSNGKEIYEGDIHGLKIKVDGEMKWCYLPVVFDNGAFWLDESFKTDGSLLTLLCEYNYEPLNIVGNIHENSELK